MQQTHHLDAPAGCTRPRPSCWFHSVAIACSTCMWTSGRSTPRHLRCMRTDNRACAKKTASRAAGCGLSCSSPLCAQTHGDCTWAPARSTSSRLSAGWKAGRPAGPQALSCAWLKLVNSFFKTLHGKEHAAIGRSTRSCLSTVGVRNAPAWNGLFIGKWRVTRAVGRPCLDKSRG